jgi:hypothetical protein
MQAGKLHAQSQWNGISPIVNGLPSEDATELYKFWTDSTKELSGSSSADWLESLVFRYQFCQRFPNEAAAIRKEVVEAKVTPGDTRQRLAYLRLLSVINDINDKGLQEISIDQFLDGVPMDRAGLDLYLEASRYYSNKQLYEKSNKCTKDLLEAISQMLPAEDSWLRPYIFKLVPDGGTNRSDPTRYLSQFVFMIKMHRQMHDYRLLADEVSSQLSMRHQVKDEESLIEDQLTMLGASGDSNPAIVESVMRRYVYMLEGLKHIQYQEGAQPNLELVKQAHCFFLKGALQESWKKPTRGKGKTVVAFSLDTHGIKDAHITHSCGQKSNDQSALRAFSVIEDPALPASELHFEATLDQETGILSIS